MVVVTSINLNIKEGSLVAIIGTVGSGKTSLLSAILGEMNCTDKPRTYDETKHQRSSTKIGRRSSKSKSMKSRKRDSQKVKVKSLEGEVVPLVATSPATDPHTPLASIVINVS